MRRLLNQFLGIGMIALLASCGKDVDVFTPAVLESGDISTFFEAAKTTPLHYEWDASEQVTIKLPSKGQVIIPANAFALENGQAVTGMVQTKVIEIADKGSLLGNRQNTTAEGLLVNAISTLHLEVTQNGQPVALDTGKYVRVQAVVDEEHASNLRVFQGDDAEGFVNWGEVQENEFPVRPAEISDEEDGKILQGIEYTTYNLGWVQCGSYLQSEGSMDKAVLCVELPKNFSSKNTAAFLVFRNFGTVIEVDDFDMNGLPKICRDELPAGYWADLIVIAQEGEEGGYFFARELLAIPMENLTINIVPERASLSDIMLALEDL